MQKLVVDEARRLEVLQAYGVLDTPPEESIDRITRLAARLCGASMATVTLVDRDRQWFKSRVGLTMQETPREIAFCAHGIQQPEPMIIPDAKLDPRFESNPLVIEDPRLRFYACVPLVSPEGLAIGTLAVMDTEPRTPTPLQIDALKVLADQVMMAFELRFRQQALERVAAERELMHAAMLRQSETLQIAGQMARVGGWIIELATQQLIWSDTVAAIHGLEAGRTVSLEEALRYYAEPWRERLLQCVRRCVRDGEPFDEEMQILPVTGALTWVRVMAQPVRDAAGHIVRLHGVLQDISTQKRAEQELARSEENFRHLADAMPIVVWTARPDGHIDFVNQRLFEFTTEDVVREHGVHWSRSLHPDDRAAAERLWEQSVRTGQPYRVEYRLRMLTPHDDGAPIYRWYLSQAEPVRDGQGVIVRWFGSSIDIHDSKMAEEAMARLAGRLSATLESITDGFLTLDRQWRVTYVNGETERFMGRSRDSILGRVLWDEFPTLRGTVFESEYRRAMEQQVSVAFLAQSVVSGLWLEARAYPSEEGLIVFARDVTEQHHAEEALRESQRQLTALMGNLPGMAYRCDPGPAWRMRFVSDGARDLTGYDAARLVGDEAIDFQQVMHEDDRERVFAEEMSALNQGRPFRLVYRIRCADGLIKWVQEHGQGVFNARGELQALEGIITDISDLRQAEEQAQRDARVRAELVRVQQEIASSNLSLGDTMKLMCQRAMEVTGATGAEAELVEDQWLVCQASAGLSPRPVGHRIPLGTTLGGLVVRTGEAVVCVDSDTDARVDRDIARSLGARSMVVVPLRTGSGVIGTLRVSARVAGQFSQREVDAMQILVESLGATVQRVRINERLSESEAKYRLLFDQNPLPMWVCAAEDLRILAVNPAAMAHYGFSEAEFMARCVPDFWPPEERAALLERTNRRVRPGQAFDIQVRHVLRNGTVIDVDVTARPIEFAGQVAWLSLLNDVTARRRVERDFARVSRAQRMLSACNEALIRAEAEPNLLEQICRITVDIGGYRMAWVGLAQEDEDCSVQPVAHAGAEFGFLAGLKLSWSPDSPYGDGSVGRTVRSRSLNIVEDIENSPYLRPWSARAVEFGYRGLICLPLNRRAETHAFGVLCLYSSDVAQISEEEKHLLQELADDLAFGIVNLRAHVEQRRIQDAVLKVSAAVSATSGEAFFDQLVHNMTEALGANAAFVARYLPDRPGAARTLAAVVNGRSLPSLDFELAGTPCNHLLQEGSFVATAGVADAYPDNTSLRRNNAQAYVGRRLDNAQGQPVGLLFVTYSQPLKAQDFVVNTLQIFAARAAAELERLEADRRIRDQAALLDKARDAILVRDMDHRIRYWNKGAERMYGWSSDEVMGRRTFELLYAEPAIYQHAVEQLMRDGEWVGEIVQKRKDGSLMPVEGRWTVVYDDRGQPQGVLAINTDITERKATDLEIQKLAFFDVLTGLPNRQLLMDRLQHALLACQRNQTGGALLFIDLDNFKTLNDTLGHDKGDALLRQAAHRLRDSVREVDTVARLGGDEFVIMLENLGANPADIAVQAQAVGEKVLAAMSTPYELDGYEHRCSSSIGVAPFTPDHGGAGELLRQADIAMYQAKAAGRNTLRFFDPGLESAVKARAALEADLRQAVANHEFLLHYQPQVDGQGGVFGVEALLRWQHPVRGLVSPVAFIPLAEETGLILPMGQWVLRSACELLARWDQGGTQAGVTVSVNVSARQFHHVDFVPQVIDALNATGADPTRLKLELTESLLVEDTEDTIAKMGALKRLGVGFSLDDFGTGYSSLSYLKRLPLDQLKIDRSFVSDVLSDGNDSAIARTIIALGHTLGLHVIAEGVETQAQREFLLTHGCDAFQGYLISRPMPLPELEAFMATLQEKR